MNPDADAKKFWHDHAARLREFAKLRPLTPEEAEVAAKSAPSVPLSDEEIRRVVAAATAAPCEPESGFARQPVRSA